MNGVAHAYNLLNIKRYHNRIISSKVMAILMNGGTSLFIEFHWEGSASEACAAGLFKYI